MKFPSNWPGSLQDGYFDRHSSAPQRSARFPVARIKNAILGQNCLHGQTATVCSLDQGHWSIDVEQSFEVVSMKGRVYLAGFDSPLGQIHLQHHLAIAKDRICLAGFDSLPGQMHIDTILPSQQTNVYLAGFDSQPGQMHLRHHLTLANGSFVISGPTSILPMTVISFIDHFTSLTTWQGRVTINAYYTTTLSREKWLNVW